MTYDERADRFDADLAAAITAEDSDRQLVALLGRPRLDSYERGSILVALGESEPGPDGSAAVRAEFSSVMSKLASASRSTRADWRDNACAAVIALARRDGPAATDVYLAAADSANPSVHEYGMMTLAAEGDDRAWDTLLARTGEILKHRQISANRWRDLIVTVEYLARHAARGTTRAERLITLIRSNWDKLASPPQIKIRLADGRGRYTQTATATRLEELWPGIQPDGPPADALDLPRLHTPSAWWRPDFHSPTPRPACRLPGRD